MQRKRGTTVSLRTRWSRQVEALADKDRVLSEYPRPGMVRENWQCLNGLWEYAFTAKKETPAAYEGKILVPFSPETALSGVGRQLLPKEALWYKRRVALQEPVRKSLEQGGRLLLHFGAVDQSCQVWINGKEAGSHSGGYLPFTLDITAFVKSTGSPEDMGGAGLHEEVAECTITLRVEDVSDTSWYSVGKQTLKPGGMYYPATSGIWQTVWLEAVPPTYIRSLTWEARYDASEMELAMETAGEPAQEPLFLKVQFAGGEYPDHILPAGKHALLKLPDFISWSPDNPFLYRVKLLLYAGEAEGENRLLDSVESYFAMRKCSIGTDKDGIRRVFLNNRPCIQAGVLDQGYWPESMYTPPCEEAMLYDIRTMKELGFNMLRKHVKVEPDRWYYHCDRLGMLVWQDMVNGGRKNKGFYVTYLATLFNLLGIKPGDRHRFLLSRQDKEGRKAYEQELTEMVLRLKNHPSIVCIVPFNEGWGQFETNRMTDLIKGLDQSVIVDQASGWFDMGGGDLKSIHYYFFKLRYKREKERALALTEFGGYTWRVPGHYASEKEYGYKTFASRKELEAGYEKLFREVVLPAVKDGISATVYTQLSDVEEEINGILTYDREVLKLDAALVREWNLKLRNLFDKDAVV